MSVDFPNDEHATGKYDSAEAMLRGRLDDARKAASGPHRYNDHSSLSDALPLSSAQKRMWFLHVMDPYSPAYTIATAFRILGPLDTVALSKALAALMARHEMLCSFFHTYDGQPARVVDTNLQPPLEVVDLRGIDEATALGILREHGSQPFDLTLPPLFRVRVLRLAAELHFLSIEFHHIIADGWSLGIFLRELGEAYGACLLGRMPELGASPRPHLETVIEEQGRIGSENGRRALDRWAERLKDAPETPLVMSAARLGGASRGVRHETFLDNALTQRLEQVGQVHGATLFMVLQTAFLTLLHRYSTETDLVIGVPVANRHHMATESAVGLYVNTIALRVNFSGKPTFAQALSRVREATLAGLDDQYVPFEKVVERVAPERVRGRNPLFQAMIALQNADTGSLAIAGAQVEALPAGVEAVRFDLEFTSWRRPAGLTLRLVTDSAAIAPDVGSRALHHLSNILTAVASDADTEVATLPLLDPTEVEQASTCERGAELTMTTDTLPGLFAVQALRSPHAIAVEDANDVLTFSELEDWSDAIAHRVMSVLGNASQGAAVAMTMERHVGQVAALLGIMKAGAAVVPLNPGDPLARREKIMTEAGVLLELADTGITSQHRATIAVYDVPRLEVGARLPSVSGNDAAYILFTSGTTGTPKGVIVEQRNLAATLVACQRVFQFGSHDIGVVLARETFDVFFYELFAPILAGGTARIVSRTELFDPSHLIPLIGQATTMQAVPGLMEQILAMASDQGISEFPDMRTIVTGGDMVPPSLFSALRSIFPNARISVTYGPTEATIFATHFDVPRGTVTGYPIGVPLPGTVVRIGDQNGRPLPAGIAGEILVGGGGVARGYHERPLETETRFVMVDGAKFYRTGDRGLRQSDGTLRFLGRTDDQVKVRGFRIEIGEIEAALACAPNIERCAAVAADTNTSSRRVDGFVVLAPDAVEAQEALIAAEREGEWRALFDAAYDAGDTVGLDDPKFAGWNSSVNGLPLPRDVMEEWRDTTLEAIRDCVDLEMLAARQLRVLEIGCGNGLILLGLAEHASRYVGTDFSAYALSALQKDVLQRGLGHVELKLATATDRSAFNGEFDLVVINSVSQYFPSKEYLSEVVDLALAACAPDGRLFIGDVRNLALLECMHTEVEAARDQNASIDVLRERVIRAVRDESELNVHPAFFLKFAPKGATVTVSPRRGRIPSELTRYRFDAIIQLGTSCVSAMPPVVRSWASEGWTMERLERSLSIERVPHLLLSGVPNALLTEAIATWRRLFKDTSILPLGAPINIDDVRELAAREEYHIAVNLSCNGDEGKLDLAFTRGDQMPEVIVTKTLKVEETNRPLKSAAERRLLQSVREYLADNLPDYMRPATLTALERMPMSANNKVDRSALPIPEIDSTRRLPETRGERIVSDAFARVLGVGSVSADANFFEIGGTSLLAIQAAVLLRAQGHSVSPQAIFDHRTVEALGRVIEICGATPPDKLMVHPHVGDDERISATPPVLHPVDEETWIKGRCVFLTGATGYLGIHLLAALLERGVTVVCLVRGSNDEAALDRLRVHYNWSFPNHDFKTVAHRVHVIAGDLRAPQLGLSDSAWRMLASVPSHVIHAAADVRHVADRGDIFATNAIGTQTLLQLFADRPSVSFHHISTIGVKGITPSGRPPGRLTEADSHIGQRFTEAYSASKMAAENYVRKRRDTGGKASIYRVGTIAPHSVTGRFQRKMDEHFFTRIIKACIDLQLCPDLVDRQFQLIPVDIMAEAILSLGGRDEANGHTFHIQSPHRVSYSQIAEILREFGYPLTIVPTDIFVEDLKQFASDPKKADAVGRLLAILDRKQGNSVSLDYSWTSAWLDALGRPMPAPTRAWFASFLRFASEEGFLPPIPGAFA
ncbi:hypothetical protein CDO28_34380 (plasmid) [Sinorhizobium meliloti]|uniref:non-ribosomal peptide synthetase n=1 Tax=Rhizobium meliloti TaxID=382 RepID=UPI000B4A1209|nr:non-ribosomal peptide synthetase [Sinorhizobium meliloti]ASP76465.1 hypothetical protein CDO28_34380 [Sinorhizobium meliloti]MDE3857071.1 non-ribosomal peptide synthetase [Sinorhizobium meliloti]MQW47971.1 non-ribosomal peptide synthetase [Sinorhizobium meliloti]